MRKNTIGIITAVRRHFQERGDQAHFCDATRDEYIKAAESLMLKPQHFRDLPAEYEYYNTMADLGLILKTQEPVYWQNQPRGVRISFALKPDAYS